MSAPGANKRKYSGPQGYQKGKRAPKMYRKSPALSSRYLAARTLRDVGYVDLASAGYAMDTTGTVTLIPTIAQGASVNQRIGKKAMLKSLQFRGLATAGSAATVNDCSFLIVYDKRPTGSLPAVTDILLSANSVAFNNDVNSGRFRILKRVDFALVGNSTTPATGREIESADFYLKINRPIVFKAAGTGAIADIEEGALYLVTVGNNTAGTSAATLTGGFRTRFIDM